jgi:hypothetical protein
MRYSATGCQQVAKSESGGRGTAARIYFRAAYREGNGQSGRARNRGRRLGAARENRRPPLGWKSRPAASAGDRSRRPGAEGRARPKASAGRSGAVPGLQGHKTGNRREGTAARIYFRAAKKREGNRAERQASRKTGVFHLPRDIGDKSAVFLHFAKMRNRYSPKTL